MKKHLSLAAAAVLLAGFAVAPTFAKGHVDPETKFKQLDTNNDNKLSLDEFKAGAKNPDKAEKQFKHMDTDKDGFLSLDEFKAGMAHHHHKKPAANQ